jgi:hypothetical protein
MDFSDKNQKEREQIWVYNPRKTTKNIGGMAENTA